MRGFGIVVVLAAAAFPAAAQSGFRDSVTVTPGPTYAKSGIYQLFFGRHYRDLWTTPIRVPVLDLSRFAGGLRPVRRGGGQQTMSLRLQGGDGREYQFRSVDKDPSAALPPDLRETFADRIFQDQISSGHPVGALVVPPILDVAGVLHARPVLVMMPDDPALGEFRSEFANVLGTIEERPRDADDEGARFAGALDVVSTSEFLRAIESRPAIRLDSRAFLKARLIDVFLGDWDRHRDQWRWALVDGAEGRRWLPIPRDRDQAFVRFDGLLLNMIRQQVPQLVNFGPRYPPIVGATWNGRDLDRRLLSDLAWPAWDSVASDLQGLLTNEVIDRAVRQLPPEYQPIDGPRLRTALLARRDGLPRMARDYYRHLAGQVDIHASDQPDVVRVERVDDRFVEVTIGEGEPWYRRRFDRRETSDLRLYLHGGNDRATVVGTGSAGIMVRLIGGGGDDVLANESPSGRIRLYDERGTNQALGARVDTRPYQAVDNPDNPKAVPHRDWGSKRLSFPFAAFGPDAGAMVGWGGRFTRYGFRKKPWSSRFVYTAVVATGAGTGRLHATYRMMRGNSRSFWEMDGLVSGIEVLRWHGFGNESTIDPEQPASFYRATQHQVVLAPSWGWAIGERSLITFGPRFKYAVTELDDPRTPRFIAEDRPFGSGGFTQLGVGAELEVDTRDVEVAAQRGVHLTVGARFHPSILDVTHSYATISAEGATYLTARMPMEPTLAVQAGATSIWGTRGRIPYHDAAFLGSSNTLRGYRTHRFAGDEGALWGSAELRLKLANLFILVPGRQGVFGFPDAGRVLDSGDRSNLWHTSFGGGVWMSFLTRGSLVSLSMGHSEEGNRFHARAGFAF